MHCLKTVTYITKQQSKGYQVGMNPWTKAIAITAETIFVIEVFGLEFYSETCPQLCYIITRVEPLASSGSSGDSGNSLHTRPCTCAHTWTFIWTWNSSCDHVNIHNHNQACIYYIYECIYLRLCRL